MLGKKICTMVVLGAALVSGKIDPVSAKNSGSKVSTTPAASTVSTPQNNASTKTLEATNLASAAATKKTLGANN